MSKNVNVWANYVSKALVRERKTQNGKTFLSVSMPYSKSVNGWASFNINSAQARPCKNKAGEEIKTMYNLLLGDPNATRKVSICTKLSANGKGAEYAAIEMTNQQIADAFRANRKSNTNNDGGNAQAELTPFVTALRNETEEDMIEL